MSRPTEIDSRARSASKGLFHSLLVRRAPVIGLLATLFLGLPTFAQPAFFEPAQAYYKARGKDAVAKWSVDRTTLPDDGVITAMLTIRGAVNPHEIVRPDLAKVRNKENQLPYSERFQIEDVPSRPAPADAKEVKFVYLLRPRNHEVNRLPTLDFYVDTGVKVGDPFQNRKATGIDLVVTKVEKPKPQAVPLFEPERLFQIETGSRVLSREPFSAGSISWLWLFLLGAIIALVWYLIWRRIYPEGARLARLRRSRAVRRATDAIRKAGRSPDPAGAIAAAMLGYLRTRFPLPPGVETPSEVEEALRQCRPHAPREDHLAERDDYTAVIGFLRRCDEARFAPSSDNPLSLAADAEKLLVRVEAAE